MNKLQMKLREGSRDPDLKEGFELLQDKKEEDSKRHDSSKDDVSHIIVKCKTEDVKNEMVM